MARQPKEQPQPMEQRLKELVSRGQAAQAAVNAALTATPEYDPSTATEYKQEASESQPKMTGSRTLVKKLSEVLGAIGWIPKNGRNEYFKYNYVREADLADAVRKQLADHQIFILTSVVDESKDGTLTKVRLLHTFLDGESGESLSVESVGYGEDKADKGIYKAITGAMKYFLMKQFLVSSGDDPEEEKNDKERAKENKPAENKAKAKVDLKETPKPAEREAQNPDDTENLKKLARHFKEVFGQDKIALANRLKEITREWLGEEKATDSFFAIDPMDVRALLKQIDDKQITVAPKMFRFEEGNYSK